MLTKVTQYNHLQNNKYLTILKIICINSMIDNTNVYYSIFRDRDLHINCIFCFYFYLTSLSIISLISLFTYSNLFFYLVNGILYIQIQYYYYKLLVVYHLASYFLIVNQENYSIKTFHPRHISIKEMIYIPVLF